MRKAKPCQLKIRCYWHWTINYDRFLFNIINSQSEILTTQNWDTFMKYISQKIFISWKKSQKLKNNKLTCHNHYCFFKIHNFDFYPNKIENPNVVEICCRSAPIVSNAHTFCILNLKIFLDFLFICYLLHLFAISLSNHKVHTNTKSI